MRHLTVRGNPEGVAEALDRERSRRGISLNQTVIDLLTRALGVRGVRSNDLAAPAGGGDRTEFEAFEAAITLFERVDSELWG